MKQILRSIPLLALTLIFGCENESGNPCDSNFDQQAMLQNYADNLIIPAYQDLDQQLATLRSEGESFVNAPSTSTLAAVQNALEACWVSWQYASPFEFGPAEAVFLRNSFNNFPVNAGQIDDNVTSGDYELDNPDRFDKGLPACDYLLFGLGDDEQAIVDAFTSGPNAAGYQQYLLDVVSDMQNRLDQTLQSWTGGYRDDFIANTGNAAGSGLSLIINSLNQHHEITKRERLGVPSGAVTMLDIPNPDRVEAFYAGISAQLAGEALRATRKYYLGETASGNGQGLDDYLNEVGARKADKTLDGAILDQLNAATAAVDGISDPLSEAVAGSESEKTAVRTAYAQASNLVVLLKTDMPSVLCVSITYVDNPSDSD